MGLFHTERELCSLTLTSCSIVVLWVKCQVVSVQSRNSYSSYRHIRTETRRICPLTTNNHSQVKWKLTQKMFHMLTVVCLLLQGSAAPVHTPVVQVRRHKPDSELDVNAVCCIKFIWWDSFISVKHEQQLHTVHLLVKGRGPVSALGPADKRTISFGLIRTFSHLCCFPDRHLH